MGKKNYKNKQKKKNTKYSNNNSLPNSKNKGGNKLDTFEQEKHFEEFQESIKPKGLYLRNIESDGNCLFRAVADQLEGNEKNYKKYRIEAVEYIKEHKDHFAIFLLDSENIEDYIKRLEKDGTWGGHFELIALSDIYKVQFLIHMKDKEPVLVKSDSIADDARILNLAYHVGEHYTSVRKLEEIGKDTVEEIPSSKESKQE